MAIKTIELTSALVTWEELGFKRSSYDTKTVNQFAQEATDWVEANCSGDVRVSERGFWFSDGGEAALFKLTWANQTGCIAI